MRFRGRLLSTLTIALLLTSNSHACGLLDELSVYWEEIKAMPLYPSNLVGKWRPDGGSAVPVETPQLSLTRQPVNKSAEAQPHVDPVLDPKGALGRYGLILSDDSAVTFSVLEVEQQRRLAERNPNYTPVNQERYTFHLGWRQRIAKGLALDLGIGRLGLDVGDGALHYSGEQESADTYTQLGVDLAI